MDSSSALLCAMFLSVLAFAQARVTLRDLSGVWSGEALGATANILLPEGLGALCVDSLPQECIEQTPLTFARYTINGTTLNMETGSRIGVTTREQSAAQSPACAAAGIYPVEGTSSIPPSRILYYSSRAGRLFYIDPRRPSRSNCAQFKYGVGARGAFVEIQHTLSFDGTIEEVFSVGPRYSCSSTPVECFVEFYGEERVRFIFEFRVTLYCIDGDCLNAAATSPAYP